MDKKLVLKPFGGEPVGEISLVSGNLVVKAYLAGNQASLEAIVTRVASGTLTYLTSMQTLEGGKMVTRSVSKQVQPQDEGYLPALADALSKPGIVWEGKRLRAYMA